MLRFCFGPLNFPDTETIVERNSNNMGLFNLTKINNFI